MKISLIVAIGKNREIGFKNQMLWHLKDDFKNFKAITMGHHLVMGRKTFESIGRPLPGRTTIVLSRDPEQCFENCLMVPDVKTSIELAQSRDEKELFVCGGEGVYEAFLPLCHKLYLTKVDFSGDADAFFPSYDDFLWHIIEDKSSPSQDGQLAFDYQVLVKNPETSG